MEQNTAHRAADTITALLRAHVSDEPSDIDIHDAIAARDDIRELAYELEDDRTHSFDVGDYAIDDTEPTPSPEVNTVEIVELIDQRADEFVVEETGKTVSEHKHNRYYPDDDLVVAGVYPNMGDPDRVWHFPESRLRQA